MVIFEFLGAISGIVGIWLTLRQNIWCFPVGLFSVANSFFVFLGSKLYADALQQLVFATLLIIGWSKWSKSSGNDSFIVSKMEPMQRISWLLVSLFAGSVLGFLLDRFTDAHYPWLDSMLTALCFLAQYLVALRKIENWWLWIFTNAGYVFVYLKKDLEPYVILYAAYLVMAFVGLREWNRQLRSNG